MVVLFTFLGEPNNSSSREDCIEAGGDGHWNDIDCYIKFNEQWHGKLYYLCNKLWLYFMGLLLPTTACTKISKKL